MSSEILRPLFINKDLDEITSSKSSHYLSNIQILYHSNKSKKWSFSHSLGGTPVINVYDSNNSQIIPKKVHRYNNKIQVEFSYPISGHIVLINSKLNI